VDKIAKDLRLLKYDDGTPRYTTWQDKHNLPPASPNWWDAIVDAIEQCDIFMFHLSLASLQSEVCRSELEYAHKRNRPIIPVVLDGEFFLNPQSGKYDLSPEAWTLIPDWLRDRQLLFYIGADFFVQFEAAVRVFERSWPRDIHAPRPLNPNSKSVHSNNHAVYSAACDYAERLAFTDAEKHFEALVSRNDPDYGEYAAQWIEIIRRYDELIEIASRHSARVIFNTRLIAYRALFPKDFLDDGIFDPKGFLKHDLTPKRERSPVVFIAPIAIVSITIVVGMLLAANSRSDKPSITQEMTTTEAAYILTEPPQTKEAASTVTPTNLRSITPTVTPLTTAHPTRQSPINVYELSQVFRSVDNNLLFNYPSGWVVGFDLPYVLVASNRNALTAIASNSPLNRGQVAISLLPFSTEETDMERLASQTASRLVANGGTTGIVQTVDIGQNAVRVDLQNLPNQQEGFILVIPHTESERGFAVFFAQTLSGEITSFEALLLEIASTVH